MTLYMYVAYSLKNVFNLQMILFIEPNIYSMLFCGLFGSDCVPTMCREVCVTISQCKCAFDGISCASPFLLTAPKET